MMRLHMNRTATAPTGYGIALGASVWSVRGVTVLPAPSLARTSLHARFLAGATALVLAILTSVASPGVAGAARSRVIHVNDDAEAGGDGSARSPYNNLPDALAAARATSADVVVSVAPGDYEVTSTLVIDRPLDLRGASDLIKDVDGLPTGAVAAGTETRIFAADSSLGAQTVVAAGSTDGATMSGLRVSGFVFEAAPAVVPGTTLFATRVQDFTIIGNVFRAPGFGVQTTASSGRIADNHISGASTGMIVNGGYPASPSEVTIVGNRSVRNTLGGLLLHGSSFGIPEHGDRLDAVVRNNDLSDTKAQPAAFGLRLFVNRRDNPGAPGQSSGNVRALVQDNRIAGNRTGIVIDAGFPYRRVGTQCDGRVFSGSVDLTLVDNSLTGSVLTPALVTFTRQTAAMDPSTLSGWQYLHASTISISDRHGSLAGAWIDHPERDPFVGPCPADAEQEVLGNTLLYNGVAVPNGRTF